MAAKSCSWQRYNFPSSGQVNTSQSFIDYGSASVLNVDLDEHGQGLVVHAKQSHDSRTQRLVSRQPSLPFLEPNQNRTLTEPALVDYQLSSSLHSKKLNLEAYSVHMDNFSTDHPDIMYGTAVDLLQEEMNRPPFSCCANNKDKLNFYFPWKHRDYFCKLCSNIRKASVNKDSSSGQILKQLGTNLPDIPPVLLQNLLQESNASESCRSHFDTFVGNCMSCHTLETEQQSLLIMHPSGPCLDVLNFTHVPHEVFFSTKQNTCGPFHSVLSKRQFAVHGQIKQTDFASYSHNNIVTGIRSHYHCAFFQSFPNVSEDVSPSLKLLETVALTKQAMCIAVSPYIPGESVIVTETGGTYIWTCDHDLKMVCNHHDGGQDSPWYQCVFADNPRCIAMADVKGMDLLDFRARSLFRRFFFSIPSDEVDSFECVSAIQRHPKNLHHYVLATDQSLIILDDRFLQHPVLKWRHHNEDPVQFINVACDAIIDSDDTVVMISGSHHAQTHCFQYSDCSRQVTTLLDTASEYLPPQSTCPPWKVSSFNEWHYAGPSNDMTHSPVIASRLSQPLVGICTMSHTSHPEKGFTVFQMSAAGDLFYQRFISQKCSDSEEHSWSTNREEESRLELSKEAQTLCQKWVDMIAHQEGVSEKAVTFQMNYVQVDKKNLCQDLLLLPKPHINCTLCNGGKTKGILAKDQEMSDLTICGRCGLDISYSSKLVESQQKNISVLTNNSLCIPLEVEHLPVPLDFKKVTDPLSKNLWLNWSSEEPIPVFSEESTSGHVGEQILENMCNKPVSVNMSTQDNYKTPLVPIVFPSKEQVANQSDIDIKAEPENLRSQDSVLSPTMLEPVNRVPSDGEGKYSPSMQCDPSSSQWKPLGKSQKKSKVVKRRSGHVMGF